MASPWSAGRADYVHGSRAAVVVYRHGAHVINLFAWADRNARLPGTDSRDGYRMRVLETE